MKAINILIMNITPCRYANQVLVGYEVLVQGNIELVPATVINVSRIVMQGNNIFSLSSHLFQTRLRENISFYYVFDNLI